MRKTTLVLVTIAALGLGALVGFSLVDEESIAPADEPAVQVRVGPAGGMPVFRYLSPKDLPEKWPAEEPGAPFSVGENYIGSDKAWKSETLTVELAGDSRTEYKIFMSRGDAVLFDWSVDGEEVYYDFHAHDEAFGEGFFTRYDDGRGTQRSGMIVAPYSGQHGWYWQNLEPDPETITLRVAGFFDKIERIELSEN